MTNEEIRQFIIDKIPHAFETNGITNKYYVILVSKRLSLELSIIGDAKWHRYRTLRHTNDHHINDILECCVKHDFIDCLLLLDFLKNE
jgi:hypothetical protein